MHTHIEINICLLTLYMQYKIISLCHVALSWDGYNKDFKIIELSQFLIYTGVIRAVMKLIKTRNLHFYKSFLFHNAILPSIGPQCIYVQIHTFDKQVTVHKGE